MSDMWLVLGLVGIFSAIVLGGVAIEDLLGERKRAVRLLESQISASSSSANDAAAVREKELEGSLFQRVLAPVLSGSARLAKRFTPVGSHERFARTLVIA